MPGGYAEEKRSSWLDVMERVGVWGLVLGET